MDRGGVLFWLTNSPRKIFVTPFFTHDRSRSRTCNSEPKKSSRLSRYLSVGRHKGLLSASVYEKQKDIFTRVSWIGWFFSISEEGRKDGAGTSGESKRITGGEEAARLCDSKNYLFCHKSLTEEFDISFCVLAFATGFTLARLFSTSNCRFLDFSNWPFFFGRQTFTFQMTFFSVFCRYSLGSLSRKKA